MATAQHGIAIGRAIAHEIVERQQPGTAHRQRLGFTPQRFEIGRVEAEHIPGEPREDRAGGDLPRFHQPVVVDQRMRVVGLAEAGDRLSAGSWKRCTTDVPPIISSPGAIVSADHADMRVDAALGQYRAVHKTEMAAAAAVTGLIGEPTAKISVGSLLARSARRIPAKKLVVEAAGDRISSSTPRSRSCAS